MWVDSYCPFDPLVAEKLGGNADDVFFKGLAFRVMWQLYYHVPSQAVTFHYGEARGPFDHPTAWHGKVLRAYSAALPYMSNRTITDLDASVVYKKDDCQVIWSFKDQEVRFDQLMTITDLIEGHEHYSLSHQLGTRKVYLARPKL
jgi:hypothetical protein